jgi:hypothetical protein
MLPRGLRKRFLSEKSLPNQFPLKRSAAVTSIVAIHCEAGRTPSLSHQVTLALLRRERPRLSSGKQCSDWVYISEAIDGCVAATSMPCIEGETIDLLGSAGPCAGPINRLIEIVGNDIQPEFGTLPDRPCKKIISANTWRLLKIWMMVDDLGSRKPVDCTDLLGKYARYRCLILSTTSLPTTHRPIRV